MNPDARNFPTRSGAAAYASRISEANQSFYTTESEDGWNFHMVPRDVIEAAEIWSWMMDHIEWLEENEDGVITAFTTLPEKECRERCKKEYDRPVPDYINLAPVTPSLWQLPTKVTPPAAPRTPKNTGAGAGSHVGKVYGRPNPNTATGRVWVLADENPDLDRKGVIALCVESGVNPSTASAQYARWKKDKQSAENT